MPKRIPIKAAREFSKKHGLSHFVLFAHDGTLSHVVSYGDTIEHCSQAADTANRLKTMLGWPESMRDQPSRVRALHRRIDDLRAFENEALRLRGLLIPAATALRLFDDLSAIPMAAVLMDAEGIPDRLRAAISDAENRG